MRAAGRAVEGVAFAALFTFYALTLLGAIARGDLLLCLLMAAPVAWLAGQAWARAHRARRRPATPPAETERSTT